MTGRLYTEQEMIDVVKCYGEDYFKCDDEMILNDVNNYLEDLHS